MCPIEFRRRNAIRASERMVSADSLDGDVDTSSKGLEHCLDLVKAAMKEPRNADRAAPTGWLTGGGRGTYHALRDATGIRFTAVPFRADWVRLRLAGYKADAASG